MAHLVQGLVFGSEWPHFPSFLVRVKEQFQVVWAHPSDLPGHSVSSYRSPVAVTVSANGFRLLWTLSPPRPWSWISALVLAPWLLFAMPGPHGPVNISNVPFTTLAAPYQLLPSLLLLHTRLLDVGQGRPGTFGVVPALIYKGQSFRFGHWRSLNDDSYCF